MCDSVAIIERQNAVEEILHLMSSGDSLQKILNDAIVALESLPDLDRILSRFVILSISWISNLSIIVNLIHFNSSTPLQT